MWLGFLFHFFVAVYACNDFVHRRINQINKIQSALTKIQNLATCKTPRVPQGVCVPLADCSYLLSLHKKENSLVSFILTGDNCGYSFGRLYACCPRFDELVTLPPDADSTPVNPFITSGTRKTTTKGKPEYTTRPSIFSTSTKKSTTTDNEDEFVSTERPNHDGKDYNNHPSIKLLSEDICGTNSSNANRIIGGHETDIDEFPWVAQIRNRETGKDKKSKPRVHCGGALISAQYVLTAAHCLSSPKFRSAGLILDKVRLGDWDTSSERDCQDSFHCNDYGYQDMEIEKTIIHPNYNGNRSGSPYDIALIRFREKAKFNRFVKPICLPFDDFEIYKTGNNFTAAGWGKISNRPIFSNRLLKVTLPLLERKTCTDAIKNVHNKTMKLIESQICVGGENGKDSCQGDSGGPLMIEAKTKKGLRWQTAGIVSFGIRPSCGLDGIPAVYTKVSSFLDWILDNMES